VLGCVCASGRTRLAAETLKPAAVMRCASSDLSRIARPLASSALMRAASPDGMVPAVCALSIAASAAVMRVAALR